MKLRNVLMSCCVVVGVVAPGPVSAQVSEDEFAAWAALMSTPVGAFPAIMVSPGIVGARRVSAWAIRGSTWKFDVGNNRNYNLGVSLVAPVGTKAIFTPTLGVIVPTADGADNGLMLGADLETPFWQTVKTASNTVTFSASVKGSAGYGRIFTDPGSNYLSLVGSLPLALHYELADRSTLSAMVVPGAGVGRSSGGPPGLVEGSDVRGLISIGGSWTMPSGVGFHLGTDKVVIDGGPPWVWGFSVSFVPR